MSAVLEASVVGRNQLLDRIAEYAARVEKAERLSDADTITVAEDLAALYDEGSWVEEWQAVKPAKRDVTGRVDPASRARFGQWLTAELEKQRKPAPARRTMYQLFDAHEIVHRVRTAHTVQPLTEGTIRPLKWFLKSPYADRISDVWKRAVELADGKPVTVAHVAEARREFRAGLTPAQNRAVTQSNRARTHRNKAQAYVRALFEDGDQAEAQTFHDWYVAFVKEMTAKS